MRDLTTAQCDRILDGHRAIMGISLQTKLKILRADYAQMTGHAFNHFYCPILLKDDLVPLCKGHIVNRFLPHSVPDWTVQRQDVDNFYGSFFEADLGAYRYHGQDSPAVALADKKLYIALKPKILLDDKVVDYFMPAENSFPKHYTRMDLEHNGRLIHLGLKMHPEDVLASLDKKWEIEIKKDVRVQSMVSIIKAAHLTLFELLGYRYALSRAGYFVGRRILGDFFDENRESTKADIQDNAQRFFRKFAHLVRPLQANSLQLKGTITDRFVFVCGGNASLPWALIVFVRTSHLLSAVMIPLLDGPETTNHFTGFLQDDSESIDARLCKFVAGNWIMSKDSTQMIWPKKGVLYP